MFYFSLVTVLLLVILAGVASNVVAHADDFWCCTNTTSAFLSIHVWRERGRRAITAPVQVVFHVRAFSSFRYFPPHTFFFLCSPANFLAMQPIYLYFYLSFSPSIVSLNNPSLSCCTSSPLLRSDKFPFCIPP